jgi:abortive infection bacteriophage resistance protein
LPGKNYNRNEGGGIKENDEGGEFSIWYIVRMFVNATMYPIKHNNEKKMSYVKMYRYYGISAKNFTVYLLPCI